MKQLASQCEGEGQALLARLADLAESAGRWGKPCFSAFLTEHEQAVARRMHPVPGVSCMVYNGKATACHGHFDLISICFLTVTVICINRKFIA